VSVFLIGRVADVRGDARTNLEILGRLGVTVVEIADGQAWELHGPEVTACPLIIDAIFGTGLNAPVSGLVQSVIVARYLQPVGRGQYVVAQLLKAPLEDSAKVGVVFDNQKSRHLRGARCKPSCGARPTGMLRDIPFTRSAWRTELSSAKVRTARPPVPRRAGCS